MVKISNQRENLLLVFFCLFFWSDNFCVAMKPEFMSVDCWNSYTGTWIRSRKVLPDVNDIHERMAYRIELAVNKDILELKHSNVASFALSVKYSDGNFVDLLLPFVVASCEVNAEEDSFAYYWKYGEKYMPLISVNSFFQNSPTHKFSTALATESFIKRIIDAQRSGKYEEENWHLEKAVDLLETRIKSGSYLSHTVKPVGTESGESNNILRSVLHCEQVVIDRLIVDDTFLDLFLGQLGQKKGEIVGIDFCIDTYNDMCPKCFSTCKHRKIDLLEHIVERLRYLGHNVRDISHNKFRILISSHREYKIPESEYITGKILDDSYCTTESIFQFKNEGVNSALNRISLIDQARAIKCAEIDELFRQIAAVGIKVPSSGSLIVEKKYSEQVVSIEKALTGKKDKALPSCNLSSLYDVVRAENEYLHILRNSVRAMILQINQKIKELTALHYFLTTDELRALGYSK